MKRIDGLTQEQGDTMERWYLAVYGSYGRRIFKGIETESETPNPLSEGEEVK